MSAGSFPSGRITSLSVTLFLNAFLAFSLALLPALSLSNDNVTSKFNCSISFICSSLNDEPNTATALFNFILWYAQTSNIPSVRIISVISLYCSVKSLTKS